MTAPVRSAGKNIVREWVCVFVFENSFEFEDDEELRSGRTEPVASDCQSPYGFSGSS